ncbi:3-dehydroquinate synthase II [Streptomyces monashensis]|uniref:3-dehydroquinate synthase n=1 Tax=Streptomyces monashensis TaxID=1678012 RepID=A0A1S2PS49_9ACTN|nr:3-dehydroquinate synthase II [Streptomyces monashensis]OIJ96320.1 3-dehydroquinate synthase [Streptomyces monashensis]
MKLCWLDIRSVTEAKQAILEEALHQRVDAVLTSDVADLKPLPPSLKRVLLASGSLPEDLSSVDIVIVDAEREPGLFCAAKALESVEVGRFVEIIDAATLDLACESCRTEKWSVLEFRDPTKIPLELVLAASNGADGSIITVAGDVEEAEIIFGVLEHGSDGVMMAPRAVGDITALKAATTLQSPDLGLVELRVVKTTHVGMGERACVDTCTYLRQDEGILVGSDSKGMVLCVSETHPLPYMPTRPFRVNAGAIHSYTVASGTRTNYLSELKAGSTVLAVDVKGRTRAVTVGRVKIETRPLISIDAIAPDGQPVNIIMQDDWHVRVLGPGGVVHNSTELTEGDIVLGYLPKEDRHVGYPINEFCREQ